MGDLRIILKFHADPKIKFWRKIVPRGLLEASVLLGPIEVIKRSKGTTFNISRFLKFKYQKFRISVRRQLLVVNFACIYLENYINMRVLGGRGRRNGGRPSTPGWGSTVDTS